MATQETRNVDGRRHVLQVLRDCDGYLLPENSLIDQLRLQVAPAPTMSEAEEWIRWLDSNGYIAGIRSELGGAPKWKITDKGKLAL